MGSLSQESRPFNMAVNRLEELLFDRANTSSPANLIVYSPGKTRTPTEVSYTDLYAQALSGAKRLQNLDGFRVGQPVLLHLPDHWDAILWFWSTILAGGVPALTPPFSNDLDQRGAHLTHLWTLFDSPLCITTTRLLSIFDGHQKLQLHTIESLLQLEKPAEVHHKLSTPPSKYGASETAFLMMTSGSTGNCKAVRITHKQCLASIAGKSSVHQLPPDRPFLNWIGLDHVGSLVEIHLQALWMGVDQIHVPAADIVTSPRYFLDLLDHHRVSRTFAPNFFLAKLAATIGADDDRNDMEWDLRNLKFLGSGGEANDVDVCVALSALLGRYGAPSNIITPGFGMTETCAGCIYSTDCPSHEIVHDLQFAALGHCMDGVEMRVVAGDGETPVKSGYHGDLQVRGAVVFPGYYNNPEATAEAFTSDGWFRTGDRAIIDAEGCLCLVGRAKDVININGIKVNSLDIQAAVDRAVKWKVERVITFPTRAAGAHTEQVTVAFVPKSDTEAATLEDIIAEAVLLCTESRPVVFSLASTSDLPQTTLGKVSRAKMSTLFEGGAFEAHIAKHKQAVEHSRQSKNRSTGRPSATPANGTEVTLLEAFIDALDILNPNIIDVNMSIFTLGCTSMDLIRLRSRVCDAFKIDIPTITFIKHPTVRLLAAALDAVNSPTQPTSSPSSPAPYDPVVTLYPGAPDSNKTPLWLIHPGVGEVLVFIGLAQHLAAADPQRPIYALRARGFEPGHSSFQSIPEAVSAYHAAIRRVQPNGPYALAGYSYGAMLAFEVAKVLEGGDGQEVRFLASFNLPPYIRAKWKPLSWPICLLQLLNFLGLCTEEYVVEAKLSDELDGLERSRAMEVILAREQVDISRMPELGVEVQGLETWADVVYGLQQSAVGYQPSGSVRVMDVFHATPLKAVGTRSQEDWVENFLKKWSEFCKTEVRFHAVGGAHYTMIGPEHVVDFSRTLMSALKRRGV